MTSHRRALVLLVVASLGTGAVMSACGDDTTSDAPAVPDGGGPLGADGSNGGDTGIGTDGSSGADTGAPDGGADGASPLSPVTCKSIHEKDPSLPSGKYAIDLDGSGTKYPSIMVYCDMTFDGGGWTMIQSFTGADSPGNLGAQGDAGFLVAPPEPGKLGGLADWIVKELAANSSQVHIRLSFASDAGADGGTWVTSRAPDAGATTRVITNLKNLDVLTKGTDGGFEEWTGPYATSEKLSWVPLYGGGPTTCLNPVEATKYPSIYWACGNFSSMNIYAPQALCRWTYTPSTGNDPMEVFVR